MHSHCLFIGTSFLGLGPEWVVGSFGMIFQSVWMWKNRQALACRVKKEGIAQALEVQAFIVKEKSGCG